MDGTSAKRQPEDETTGGAAGARDLRLQKLLELGLEASPDERTEVLRDAEPDGELVAEALALLDEEIETFLERPPLNRLSGQVGTGADLPDLPGYTVLRPLGEGGMGRVYLATEDRADGRQVAVKMLRAQVPGRQLIRRFASERRALSRLNHPAIAQLFGAGTARDGRPFVVMEFVEGRSITRYCDEDRLGIRQRLELFVAVCRGVEHAHRRQLLHRDLKPSNLMITTRDAKPAPKIIDFGIARALDAEAKAETWAATGTHPIGTPAYMSPEALSPLEVGEHRDLDTRADVYALGVVLYELLVGVRPHESTSSSALVLMRQIMDQQPKRPSTRWNALDEDTRNQAARHRGIGSDEARRTLAGDLDWIVMKAIERDRERRYGSVGALAADVERYLRHEPIEARPPSLGYRMSCLIRRHRAAALAAGLALLALLVGTVGATVGMLRAREAEAKALEAEALAKAETLRASREAETASRVSDVLVELFAVADPSKGGPSTTMEVGELLERGTAKVRDGLGDEPAIQARLMSTLGDIYRVVGDYERSREHLETALALWEQDPEPDPYRLGQTLNHLAVLDRNLGNHKDAEARLRRALVLWEEGLGPGHPRIGGLLNNLGNVNQELGRYEEAAVALERALAIWEEEHGPDHRDVGIAALNLGNVWNQLGRDEEAILLYRRAGKIFEALVGPDHPHVAVVQNNIADSQSDLGNYEEAESALREALRIRTKSLGPNHSATLKAQANLGNVLLRGGRIDEAEPLLVETLAKLEDVLGPDHPEVAFVSIYLSEIRRQQGQPAEALDLALRAVSILEGRVSADVPNLRRARQAVAAAREAASGRAEGTL